MLEFLKGGALSIDRLIEERAPPLVKNLLFYFLVIILHLDGSGKSLQKSILLVVSGGEQLHFEFMTKISNGSRPWGTRILYRKQESYFINSWKSTEF